jgi:hypothetical protein
MPDEPMNIHRHKAQIENQEMLNGQAMGVAYYDPAEIHVPEHRNTQVQAELSGALEVAQIIELHIRQHLQVEAMNAQESANAAQPTQVPGLPAGSQPPPAGGAPTPEPGVSPPAGGSPLNIQVLRSINKVGSQGTRGGVKE